MAKTARRVTLVITASGPSGLAEGFAEVLASHLLGTRPKPREVLALPGWPEATVDEVGPKGGEVVPGTEIEIHVPPVSADGPLSVAFVVDASLTMGKGAPSAFQRAARFVDAMLLNGRSFIQTAGIVVQGGATRDVQPPRTPEEMSGVSILKITPQGTFDLGAGIARAVELVRADTSGPRVVVILTDGSTVPRDTYSAVRPAVHQGVRVVALTFQASERLHDLCRLTGGLSTVDVAELFKALADLAGIEAQWAPPPEVQPEVEPEFEVVIEAMEES